jgi:hypothetical protein
VVASVVLVAADVVVVAADVVLVNGCELVVVASLVVVVAADVVVVSKTSSSHARVLRVSAVAQQPLAQRRSLATLLNLINVHTPQCKPDSLLHAQRDLLIYRLHTLVPQHIHTHTQAHVHEPASACDTLLSFAWTNFETYTKPQRASIDITHSKASQCFSLIDVDTNHTLGSSGGAL